MNAVKAIYTDGSVKFIQKPPYPGTCEILIIFPDKSMGKGDRDNLTFQGTREMDKILAAEPDWEPERFIER